MDNLHQLKLVRKEAKRIADFFGNIKVGSGTTDAAGDATVTFPGGFIFSSTPKVFLQGDDAATRGIVLDKYDVTTTGFKVKSRKVTGLPTGQALKGIHYETNYGLINIRYTTASAVTGIPTYTGYNGPNHTHGIGSPSTTSVLVGMHYHHGLFAAKYDHTHTKSVMGGPSDTTLVATKTHLHPIGYDLLYTVGGFSDVSNLGDACVSTAGYIYKTTDIFTRNVALVRHKHLTNGPSSSVSVGSYDHTHTFTTTGPSTTQDVVTDLYTEAGDWTTVVKGIPSATGGASAYSHRHSIGSPTWASFVDSLDVPAPPDPDYWREFVVSLSIEPDDVITVVTGDAPTLAVDFDFLAILP